MGTARLAMSIFSLDIPDTDRIAVALASEKNAPFASGWGASTGGVDFTACLAFIGTPSWAAIKWQPFYEVARLGLAGGHADKVKNPASEGGH